MGHLNVLDVVFSYAVDGLRHEHDLLGLDFFVGVFGHLLQAGGGLAFDLLVPRQFHHQREEVKDNLQSLPNLLMGIVLGILLEQYLEAILVDLGEHRTLGTFLLNLLQLLILLPQNSHQKLHIQTLQQIIINLIVISLKQTQPDTNHELHKTEHTVLVHSILFADVLFDVAEDARAAELALVGQARNLGDLYEELGEVFYKLRLVFDLVHLL